MGAGVADWNIKPCGDLNAHNGIFKRFVPIEELADIKGKYLIRFTTFGASTVNAKW